MFLVDREKGLLRFGNGLTGRACNQPSRGSNIWLRYFAGGGDAGNIGSNRNFEGVPNADLKASNLVAAQGGAEPESLDSARRRAASALRVWNAPSPDRITKRSCSRLPESLSVARTLHWVTTRSSMPDCTWCGHRLRWPDAPRENGRNTIKTVPTLRRRSPIRALYKWPAHMSSRRGCLDTRSSSCP